MGLILFPNFEDMFRTSYEHPPKYGGSYDVLKHACKLGNKI